MCAADFKEACKTSGIALIIIFVARCLSDVACLLIGNMMSDCDGQLVSFVQSVASAVFLYGFAIAATSKVFGYRFDASVYKKPKRMGKAISWFVPVYGASQAVNLIVIVISFLLINNVTAVEKAFEPMVYASGSREAWYLVFTFLLMVVVAPLFEEYWFRGVIQTSLSRYGNGFAIMVSALCFGMAHGNIQQFCYCFVMGICMGYVHYATGSILPTTIIHALLNSIAAIVIVVINTSLFSSAVTKMQKGISLAGEEETILVCLSIFVLIVLIVLFVGIGAAIGKLKKNRLYRPVNNYPSLSSKQKVLVVCADPVFIIGFVLCTAYIIAMIFI